MFSSLSRESFLDGGESLADCNQSDLEGLVFLGFECGVLLVEVVV
jgi:hypothetical protein